jgi:hypothetical protein
MFMATLTDRSKRGIMFIFSGNIFNFVLNLSVCILQKKSLKGAGKKSL